MLHFTNAQVHSLVHKVRSSEVQVGRGRDGWMYQDTFHLARREREQQEGGRWGVTPTVHPCTVLLFFS